MSPVLRFQVSIADPTQESGGPSSELASLGATLDKLRDEMCDIDEKMLAGEIAIPPSKQPLHGGFAKLPAQLLDEYEAGRPVSQLGRMLAATKQLMTEVDRVVVLADRDFLSGARALMHACCQPHFNELTRGERGSRPRLSLVGDSLDNDGLQGVLQLVGAHRQRAATHLDERWGLVVIAGSGWPGPAGLVCSAFVRALQVNCEGDERLASSRTIVIASDSSPVRQANAELQAAHLFDIPDGVGARYSILSLAGLVPAALVGMNVMKLLEGARAMQAHFASARAAENLVLQYAAVNHLFEVERASPLRRWSLWSDRLQSLADWYQHLLHGSLGQTLKLEPPQPWDNAYSGKRAREEDSSLLHQVVASRFRFDPLVLKGSAAQSAIAKNVFAQADDAPNDIGNLAEVSQAALAKTQQRMVAAGRPVTQLALPQVDEPSVGQLLQWLMLSSVVEARLRGRNPYN